MGSNTSRQDDTRAVLDAVRQIVHALRESSRWAEQHVGVSGAQLFLLQRLAEAPAISVNGLAALTHTHQSSVSAVVTRLVERGLVRRSRSGADARRVQLSLAPAGERLVAQAPDVAQDRLIRGVERIAPARRRALATTLAELAQAVAVADRAPGMFFEDHARQRSRKEKGTRNA